MRTLTTTQLTAQQQLATTPIASLSLRPATAGEDRYRFPAQTGWQFPGVILGAAPFAIAAGAGRLSIFALYGGHVHSTSFSGSPPVQGATVDQGLNPDTIIAAAADSSRIAYITTGASPTIAHLHVYSAGAWGTVEPINTTQAILAISCAWSGDGRLLVLMAQSGQIQAYLRTAHNVFAGPYNTTYPVGTTAYTGIAAAYSNPVGAAGSGDWLFALGISTATTANIYTAVLGDGAIQPVGTFAPPVLGTTTNLSTTTLPGTRFTVSSLVIADTPRIATFEDFQNQPAGLETLHNYLQSALSPAQFKTGYLREPVPINIPAIVPMQAAVDASSSRFWLVARDSFTYADPPVTSDLSSRILSARTSEDESKSTAHLMLDNADGSLSSLLSLDSIGTRATIQFGYRTTAGNELSQPRQYWVTTIHALHHSGYSVIDLQAADAWLVLASYRPRRTQTFAAGSMTVAQLIQWILARAGLPFTPPGSPSTLLLTKPAFTITPNLDGIHAVHALLDLVPEVLLFDSSGGRLLNPDPAAAAVYTYGPQAHPLIGARRTITPQGLNHVQIFGNASATARLPTLIADSFDTDDAARVGDFPTVITDRQLSTALAQTRADATLRKTQLIQDTGELATVPNIGLEIWDPIAITYPGLNWNSSVSRVRAIQTDLDFTHPDGVFTQSVGLQNR